MGIHPTAVIAAIGSTRARRCRGALRGDRRRCEDRRRHGDRSILFPGPGREPRGRMPPLSARDALCRRAAREPRDPAFRRRDRLGRVWLCRRGRKAHGNFHRLAKSKFRMTWRSAQIPPSIAGRSDRTEIGAGTKLDNLVHIAHNVRIGENTVIAAQTGISGSASIGRNVAIGGQVLDWAIIARSKTAPWLAGKRASSREDRSQRADRLGHAGAAAGKIQGAICLVQPLAGTGGNG